MNQEFHDHLDACVRCRTHPLDLCRAGVKLLYQAVGGSAPVLAPQPDPPVQPRCCVCGAATVCDVCWDREHPAVLASQDNIAPLECLDDEHVVKLTAVLAPSVVESILWHMEASDIPTPSDYKRLRQALGLLTPPPSAPEPEK